MDYLGFTLALQDLAEKSSQLTVVAPTVKTGDRTPKAQFTVIGKTGEIMQVTVKRQAPGNEGELVKA